VSDVVTGEAVVVEVRVAQMASRAVALAIDLALQFAAILGLNFLLGMLTVVTEEAFAVALTILLIALIVVGYPVIFETLSRGRSLGKLAMGLRVVSDDGGPERFRQALFRGLSGLLEFWMFLGAPALISSLISPQGKRLGDIFSGTIVISERVPRQGPPLQIPGCPRTWRPPRGSTSRAGTSCPPRSSTTWGCGSPASSRPSSRHRLRRPPRPTPISPRSWPSAAAARRCGWRARCGRTRRTERPPSGPLRGDTRSCPSTRIRLRPRTGTPARAGTPLRRPAGRPSRCRRRPAGLR
jgi:uncharacterized RDD family membrane protein YckC